MHFDSASVCATTHCFFLLQNLGYRWWMTRVWSGASSMTAVDDSSQLTLFEWTGSSLGKLLPCLRPLPYLEALCTYLCGIITTSRLGCQMCKSACHDSKVRAEQRSTAPEIRQWWARMTDFPAVAEKRKSGNSWEYSLLTDHGKPNRCYTPQELRRP